MKLCFLDASPTPGGVVRGCALVTDARTRPLEFRVTEPVVASDLQGILYGAVYDEHVLGDLCAIPLLEALREAPDCILVRDQALLGLQSARAEPVLWIGRDDEADEVEGQPAGVVVGFHGDGSGEATRRARQALRDVAEHYDLLEPFERIAQALVHLNAQVPAGSRSGAGTSFRRRPWRARQFDSVLVSACKLGEKPRHERCRMPGESDEGLAGQELEWRRSNMAMRLADEFHHNVWAFDCAVWRASDGKHYTESEMTNLAAPVEVAPHPSRQRR